MQEIRPRIVAMVPARIGSQRLKMKNLALLAGRPLISYALEAARDAKVFDRVIVNTDSELFRPIAEEYGAEFYLRPPDLGGSTIKSDQVVQNFVEAFPCDIIAWVNTTSPLANGDEVREVIRHFENEKLDSLFTVRDEQVHCVFKNQPVNFRTDEIFAQTQDLVPVQRFVYSIMMWRTAPFLQAIKNTGAAFFVGKVGYFPVSKHSSFIIKTEEDLQVAEALMRMRDKPSQVEYYDGAR